MNAYSFSTDPPRNWQPACMHAGLLFHTAQWQALLDRSFGSRTIYAWNSATGCGSAITVFKAGPFEIGYLGFPFGGMLGSAELDDNALLRALQQRSSGLPTCIRVAVSAFGANVPALDLPYVSTPESAIVELESWDLASASANIRRDVKKAGRSGLDVIDGTDPSVGTAIFEMYRATVQRFSGSMRYSKQYFSNLVELSKVNPNLRVLIAKMDDEIAGFNVVVCHGDTAFYLHGGTRLVLREHRPASILMNEAIRWGQDSNCKSFNLMSSPSTQPSLVQYKEKWGAETKEHRTYTLPLRRSYQLMRIAERLYRIVR